MEGVFNKKQVDRKKVRHLMYPNFLESKITFRTIVVRMDFFRTVIFCTNFFVQTFRCTNVNLRLRLSLGLRLSFGQS
jgi:hypothetical protein